MPYKVFVAGEEALAADANQYLMSQTVPRFSSAAQRTSQLTAPVLNQLSILDSAPGGVDYWDGAAWVRAGAGAELQYIQQTSNVSITNTSFVGGHLVITGVPKVYDGSPVLLEYCCPSASNPQIPAGQLMFALADGTTDLGWIAVTVGQGATGPIRGSKRITPTAGSHTFQVVCWAVSTGGGANPGTVAGGPGNPNGYVPGYLRISRV